jgi:uncharacterized cupin superfamily protein
MKIAIQVVTLLVAVLPTQLHAAPKVLQLNAEKLNALELEAFEPWPDSFVISGVSEHAEKELHRGEFVVSLYEAKPVLLDISVPFTIDEFVWVLDGELTLTHVGGRSETYVAGDTLLVPKGFKGTWEMRGNYRELVVIETRANDSGDSLFKMAGLMLVGLFRDAPEMLPLKAEQLNRVELQPVEPTAADLEMVGDRDGWKAVGTTRLYEGEIIVEVYASPPAVVEISAPFPYDEFVWMLDGELVLTPVDGQAVTYGPGDAVLVPKGFLGTWETRGNYRELIIIEADAMERVHEE